MASTKSFKFSYSNKKESHHEFSSQSNHAKSAWADKHNHAGVGKSTNFYTQAQCAQPSPSVHVLEDHHVEHKVTRQESHKAEQWATSSPKCSNPVQATQSKFSMHKEEHMIGKTDQGIAMHKEEHMMGKMEQGLGNKLTQGSGISLGNQYGVAMHKEEHMMGKVEQGWANKPAQLSSISQGNQYGLSMHKEDNMIGKMEQGWANKPIGYSAEAGENQNGLVMHEKMENSYASKPVQPFSPGRGNQHGLSMHKEDNMVGKMEQGWGNKPTGYSAEAGGNQYGLAMHEKMDNSYASKPIQPFSPGRANQHGQSMLKEQEAKVYKYSEGGIESGWASTPSKYSVPHQSNHLVEGMYKEQEWAAKPNKWSNQSTQQEEYMKGKMDHGWGNSPSNSSYPSRASHAGLGVHRDEHLMGGVDNSWTNAPEANYLGHGMYKEQNTTGKADHGWANGPEDNYLGHGMYKKQNMTGKGDHDWVDAPSNLSYTAQANHSSLGMYKEHSMMGKVDHVVGNSPTRLSSPVGPNQYGRSMYKDQESMAHGYSGNRVENGWANSPTKYSGPNQFGHSGHAMYKQQQQHGWAGNASDGFGAAQVNHSAYSGAAYNFGDAYDHEDENTHDIMDEILMKYPAHNVSGGGGSGWGSKSGSCVSQNHIAGYGREQAFGGSGNYGASVAQSNSKFEMKKAMNAGYMGSGMKKEYSHSSSSNKYEMKSMMNNGGFCNDYDD